MIFFIFSQTLNFKEPKCLATSTKDPDIICGSWGMCQVLHKVVKANHLMDDGKLNIQVMSVSERERERGSSEGRHTSLWFPCNSRKELKKKLFGC